MDLFGNLLLSSSYSLNKCSTKCLQTGLALNKGVFSPVVRIVNGAKVSNSVSLTIYEWTELLQHKDLILSYLHGNFSACKTTDVIAYDLQHHEILLKEVYSRRALIINECLALTKNTAAADSPGKSVLTDITNISITTNSSTSASENENENASVGVAKAPAKRSAFEAARDAVAEKQIDVVERKRVKLPDFVGVAMHLQTVEAIFELEDLVQVKLGELANGAGFVNNILASIVVCIQRDTRDEKTEDLKKVFYSEKGFKIYFNTARPEIEKQVRTLLLQDDADFGLKYDDRIFEHSFMELQRLCHRQIVHKIFEK